MGSSRRTREHLRRERLVQLDEVDLIERQSGACQHLAHGGNRSDAEALRRDAGRGVGDKARQRLDAPFLRRAGGHQDDRSRAVARLRRIAGGDRAGGVKCRSQLREGLGGRIAPRTLVLSERHVAPLWGPPPWGPPGGPFCGAATLNVSGVISSAKRPASMAATARWWLRSAKASCSSREMA